MTDRVLPMSQQLMHLAVSRAKASASGMLDALEEVAQLSPEQFLQSLSSTVNIPCLDAIDLHGLSPAFEILAFKEAVRRDAILFRDGNNRLILSICDPFADGNRRWLEDYITDTFEWRLSLRSDIRAYLNTQESGLRAMDAVPNAQEVKGPKATAYETLSLRTIGDDGSPVVKLVNSTIYDALKEGASDIHIETTGDELVLKYRIDGVLLAAGRVPGGEFAEQVISRIKVMSELDIAERRVPQDGRFRINVNEREIDFRVSIMPSIFGEDAVLRILDKRTLTDHVAGLRLDHLGFDSQTIGALRSLATFPYGMLLVAGPTGSGKTTTLYAAISEINHGQDKIVTVEDPVEYQLPGVLQIPVNEKKGLTFARGLRSILRHDPDKIMVGEIRDPETAQIAVQAALTGHLVFSTVHANNAFDVVGRLQHMDVDSYNLVSAVNAIVGQRLLRRICPHCSVDRAPAVEQMAKSGIREGEAAGFRFRAGLGCGQCHGSGYKGRSAVAEVVHFDDELRELIAAHAPSRILKEAAVKKGTILLRDAAIALVKSGDTTLEEVNRVTLADQ